MTASDLPECEAHRSNLDYRPALLKTHRWLNERFAGPFLILPPVNDGWGL